MQLTTQTKDFIANQWGCWIWLFEFVLLTTFELTHNLCVSTIYKHGFTLDAFCTLFILAIHKCVFSLSLIGTMSVSLGFHSHLACIAPKFHIDSCILWICQHKMCIAPRIVLFIYQLSPMSLFFLLKQASRAYSWLPQKLVILSQFTSFHWFLHFFSVCMTIQ